MAGAAHTSGYKAMLPLLVEARAQAGMSQATLANKLGKPPSFVAKYELGERRLDLIETLTLLIILEADIDTFIEAIRQNLETTGKTDRPQQHTS